MDLTKNDDPRPTQSDAFDDEQPDDYTAIDLQAIQGRLSSSGVELTQEEMIAIVDQAIALETKVGRKSKILLSALVVSLAVSSAAVGTTLGLSLQRGGAYHGREHQPFTTDILAVPEDEEEMHRVLVGTIAKEDVEQAWLDALDGVAKRTSMWMPLKLHEPQASMGILNASVSMLAATPSLCNAIKMKISALSSS